MLLWERTQQLPKDLLKQVEDMYRLNFPLEVRFQLAAWLEEHCSPSVPFVPTDPDHQKNAVDVANQLMAQLHAAIQALPNEPDQIVIKSKLNESAENLKQTYSSNPIGLYCTVRHCLEQEMKIVQQAPNNSGECNMETQLRRELEVQEQRVRETSLDLDRCRQEQETVSVEYYSYQEKNAHVESIAKTYGEQHLEVKKGRSSLKSMQECMRQKCGRLLNQLDGLANVYVQIFQSVKEVQTRVLDKLVNWKQEQQLAGNGHVMNFSLDTIQEWCAKLADINWTMRQQVRQLDELQKKLTHQTNPPNILPDLLTGLTELISNLATGTFIIEKQPPQVMKTNTRFTATVRLLIGDVLKVHMGAPTVSASIVSESQANQLLTLPGKTPKRKEDYSSGDILNGNGIMEFHSATKQVSVSFRNLQLKKIKRTEKKGTESVMDEKFSVLFWTEFHVGDFKFQLFTLSMPVVVIVHGNQEPQALATVTWDNAFAVWPRRPFIVPDKVTWAQAGAALNMKWTAACGSPLTEDNLYYLACKAFRNNNLPKIPEEYNNLMLTWNLFCKETLPDRNFTFWEWFYRILILTSNHMQRLWKEGYVMGFVTKQAAENMLLQRQMGGLFLLRFSDSELGGVTIAYTKLDMYQNPSVYMVAPFTTKDLSQRSMADVIFDLSDLTTLYPETPKEMFKKFCSATQQGQSVPSSNGYVKHMLVTHVEGAGMDNSNPATPLGYDLVGSVGSSHLGEAQSPGNFGMDEMDFSESLNFVDSIEVRDSIDVRSILGLDDFMQPS